MTSKDSEFLQRRPDLAAFPFPPTQLSFGLDAVKHPVRPFMDRPVPSMLLKSIRFPQASSLFSPSLNGNLDDEIPRAGEFPNAGQPLRATLDHLPQFRARSPDAEETPVELDDCMGEDEEDESLLKTSSPSSSPSLASGGMEDARLRARAGESLVV
jgi:hypothetical protein